MVSTFAAKQGSNQQRPRNSFDLHILFMNTQKFYQAQKARRARRTRQRCNGTLLRPRMSVHRTLRHIVVQLIDDTHGTTLAAADDRDTTGTKTEHAAIVGKRIADMAQQKGITTVVFDRGPYRYHGRVKALADAARQGGLRF